MEFLLWSVFSMDETDPTMGIRFIVRLKLPERFSSFLSLMLMTWPDEGI